MKNTGTSTYAMYSGCPFPVLLAGDDGVVSARECSVRLTVLSVIREHSRTVGSWCTVDV